jgi:hypothetical protein
LLLFRFRIFTTLFSAFVEYRALDWLVNNLPNRLSRFFLGLPVFFPSFTGDWLRTVAGLDDLQPMSGVASLSAPLSVVVGVSPPDEKNSSKGLRGVQKSIRGAGTEGSGLPGDGGQLEKSVRWFAAGRRLGNDDWDLAGDSNTLREPRRGFRIYTSRDGSSLLGSILRF